ncbi:DUF4062 domain-containing protein [Runella slithyformis]|uniref:DUF4062 domain-containing protein n=1 Tax=Runella slithyformis (strain ATCC 29530 / DSM 19594 / LMG 11500 / NCIMB 11436 / LSU 4) TaxID=761193 RepID=A0A7U3ZFX6_RUNSL|nr:DUF4062 domain-containing protein [Runella slithyformis]AEI46500.1 hypothetical protein Runsl_0041 [Runella slithyformis DSM 19594]
MLEKKYQIFISSTYTDLIEARQEIIKVILNMYHIPIGMEMFSADNADQWETIQETINNSDYYLLIIGNRYGSVTNEGVGYTEKEFDYAKKMGVPIYAYIRKREIPTTPNERETNQDKIVKLDAFIEKVKNNSMVEFWDYPSDLGQKVSIALPKAFRKYPRVGWVKSDSAVSAEVLNEMAKLSKGYRELKEENEKLKLNFSNKPKFNIKFNNSESIELCLLKNFSTSKVLNKVPTIPPSYLSSDEKGYYYKDDAIKYNNWIENNPQIVSEYNDKIYHYERSKVGIEELNIKIINEGSLKANDINVTIIFSDNVVLLNEKTKEGLKDLNYPADIPESPLKIAKDAVNRSRGTNKYSTLGSRFIDSMPVTSFHESVKIEKNTLKIWIKSLLHTKSFVANDVYIMPINEGFFSAKISVICEEFGSPVEYEIPINVSLKE